MSAAPRVVLLTIPFTGFDRGLVEGVARYAQLHGPWVFYLSGDHPGVPTPVPDSHSGVFRWSPAAARTEVATPFPDLRRWNATGVIGRIQSPVIARKILASGLPAIAIDLSQEQLAQDNALSRISEIRAGSHEAGRMAAEHFLERGFRSFAFCGYEGRIWSQQRQEGFAARLGESGFSCSVYEPPRQKKAKTWQPEQATIAGWLKGLARPVAVMACNDIRGRQVLEAALLDNLNVPDDVAVVGVDDDPLICNLTNPPLSSVVFNLGETGYQAAEHLDRLMSGASAEPRRIVIEPLWVARRRSTDVIASEDQHVSAALRFIRDNARHAIDVGDVVVHSGVSRRGLEIRFRQLLGRSVREEIERSRLAYAKQLLRETNLPAERIAHLVGFESLPYFSNVFHRKVGLTPVEYRQRRVP